MCMQITQTSCTDLGLNLYKQKWCGVYQIERLVILGLISDVSYSQLIESQLTW